MQTNLQRVNAIILMALTTFGARSLAQDFSAAELARRTTVEQKDPGRFEVPNFDQASQKKGRDALLALAETVPDTKRMFGARDQADPSGSAGG
jgi:hypothetical protein